MTVTPPTLHMLCGKIASGKSTLAAKLARREGTVLISEDAWLSTLFTDQMSTGADYVRCSAKLRQIMGPHVAALLNAGVSVVLDFPANTPETRKWMRKILDLTGAAHELHLFDLPDDLCLARLRKRNAEGTHAFAVTEDLFHRFSRNFVPPSPDEGFTIVVHGETG
ncbi:AAA family ATPase [Ovoidimarina sediminis]|uniref:AAA family ATPase n=1 Tax=Ovoidimarina sediminis TaxID=3079856 RepID=UPI00290994E3|nr:ATP-binding protein [Rhodophyticola sp. MJ-SS7]MDU8945159.1 ATP-binding protein [Rhodophyticola sp. MJ-SS7]